tara:strand:+ start:1166 stop:1288 length:123 start_codon:yes stop_codon:yes gene_type:complete
MTPLPFLEHRGHSVLRIVKTNKVADYLLGYPDFRKIIKIK